MYEESNSNYKTVLTYLLGTLLIFALLSWLSYHNGMAYDGLTTVGFPLTYYSEGAGQSLVTGQMQHFSNYSLMAFAIDLAFSLLTYAAVRFLFKKLKKIINSSI